MRCIFIIQPSLWLAGRVDLCRVAGVIPYGKWPLRSSDVC